MNEVKKKYKASVNNVREELQVFPVTKLHLLVLSYQGQKGDFIIEVMKKRLKLCYEIMSKHM